MMKVAQFGEGNFLRAFADLYFETRNTRGGAYEVSILQPIPNPPLLEKFRKQSNRYHVILRGMSRGKATEEVFPVTVVKEIIAPSEEEKHYALARDKDLKIIVSNTTEAGICFRPTDRFKDFSEITFPAKLTKFLYERFSAGQKGVYLLPVELIENNADQLYRCVNDYISLWNLPEAFRKWNDRENFYCNTLVDRIVSGYPRDKETETRLTDLVGKPDGLMTVGEPFGLWAVEKKGNISDYLQEGSHNIEVILTEDISYYKKRKVRVLNGSHTNMVPMGLILGQKSVYDCMNDRALHKFFKDSLEEIIPFVSAEEEETRKFADDVEARFFNPFLNHRLTSIALNGISKWQARVLPSFRDYYEENGKIPPCLTVGFSYLMHLYQTRYDTLQDEKSHLEFFKNGGSVRDFMAITQVWGENLTAYPGFADKVEENLIRIARGETLR